MDERDIIKAWLNAIAISDREWIKAKILQHRHGFVFQTREYIEKSTMCVCLTNRTIFDKKDVYYLKDWNKDGNELEVASYPERTHYVSNVIGDIAGLTYFKKYLINPPKTPVKKWQLYDFHKFLYCAIPSIEGQIDGIDDTTWFGVRMVSFYKMKKLSAASRCIYISIVRDFPNKLFCNIWFYQYENEQLSDAKCVAVCTEMEALLKPKLGNIAKFERATEFGIWQIARIDLSEDIKYEELLNLTKRIVGVVTDM